MGCGAVNTSFWVTGVVERKGILGSVNDSGVFLMGESIGTGGEGNGNPL